MTRLHPFDHAFAQFEETFRTIRDEAHRGHRNPRDRAAFASLRSVQQLLREIEDPALVESNPTAAAEYLTTLYVAFVFWASGRNTLTVPRTALEPLLLRPEHLEPPTDGATYVHLPEHWLWAQVAPSQPHEPVDGVFVVATSQRPAEMTVLAPLGVRGDRMGFSQVSVTAAMSELAQLAAQLPEGAFDPVVEGGQAAGVRSITTPAELLVLGLTALHASSA